MTFIARSTTYNGTKMRSRLEASVAAHFDRWGYDWRYEPRAFASPAGQYLPDFELWVDGELRTVVEIKGEAIDYPVKVLDRMEVVWASEPDATLVLIEAELIKDGRWRQAQLPRASFMVRFRGMSINGRWVPGVFGLCSCGTVGMRYLAPGEIHGLCRGCKSERPTVAFLDPTEYRA